MQPASPLTGVSVLVLEVNFILADEIARVLEDAGATVIGPFPKSGDAIRALAGQRPDCALLNINLGSGPSFAAADEAHRLGIPLVMTTGYEALRFPAHFANATLLRKPVQNQDMVRA